MRTEEPAVIGFIFINTNNKYYGNDNTCNSSEAAKDANKKDNVKPKE